MFKWFFIEEVGEIIKELIFFYFWEREGLVVFVEFFY